MGVLLCTEWLLCLVAKRRYCIDILSLLLAWYDVYRFVKSFREFGHTKETIEMQIALVILQCTSCCSLCVKCLLTLLVGGFPRCEGLPYCCKYSLYTVHLFSSVRMRKVFWCHRQDLWVSVTFSEVSCTCLLCSLPWHRSIVIVVLGYFFVEQKQFLELRSKQGIA